jgi:hypothetical protein
VLGNQTAPTVTFNQGLLRFVVIYSPFRSGPWKTLRTALASVLVAIGVSAPAAGAEPAEAVAVIRGTESITHHEGVIVMRPARGSFLRETTRLAADADAREERIAAMQARESDRLLSQILGALIASAYATRYGATGDYGYPYVWMTGSQPPPRRSNITLAPVAGVPTGSPPH